MECTSLPGDSLQRRVNSLLEEEAQEEDDK